MLSNPQACKVEANELKAKRLCNKYTLSYGDKAMVLVYDFIGITTNSCDKLVYQNSISRQVFGDVVRNIIELFDKKSWLMVTYLLLRALCQPGIFVSSENLRRQRRTLQLNGILDPTTWLFTMVAFDVA
jgi:hypothetical protein